MNKAPPLSVLPTCDCDRIAHILKNCFTLYITLLSFSLNVKWLQFWYSKYNATLWDRHCYLQHKEVLAEKSVSNRSNLSLRGICCARIESCILLLQIVEKCILCCHVTSIFVYLQRDCLHIFFSSKIFMVVQKCWIIDWFWYFAPKKESDLLIDLQ